MKDKNLQNIGSDLLKKKPGRPKKEKEKEATPVLSSDLTKIWVVHSILGVDCAFTSEDALCEYANAYNRLGMNTLVWLVENGKSVKLGHLSNFRKK